MRQKIRVPVGTGECGGCGVMLPLYENPRGAVARCAPCMDAADLKHTIELKTWPQFFGDVLTGRKTFELRQDDRRFSVGDVLHLREWEPDSLGGAPDPKLGRYTGRAVKMRVTYKLAATVLAGGLMPGYCILGITPYVREMPGDDLETARSMEARLNAGVPGGFIPVDEVELAAIARLEELRRSGEDLAARIVVSWKTEDVGPSTFTIEIQRADGALEKVGAIQ